MIKKAKLCFETNEIVLPLKDILPVRHLENSNDRGRRYRTIVSSLKEVGLIEPIVVYKKHGLYLIMDGHLRYFALKELGITEARCLLSTDDESYTYNARVSRLSAIQEHYMITKAVKAGVSPKRIAASLNLKIEEVHSIINLLDGLSSDAAEILKTKPISRHAIGHLKKVNSVRQLEMADLMVDMDNYTIPFIKMLIVATPQSQMLHPEKPKYAPKLTAEEQARMEREIAAVGREFQVAKEDYGNNVVTLATLKTYVQKLLGNAKVARFLANRHPDLADQLEKISSMETL